MSIQAEINARTAKLQAILNGANQSIAEKRGVTAASLNGLPAAIDSIPESEMKLQVKGVMPTGDVITVRPDNGYDGLSAVNVAGDAYLVPGNIAKDVTIYGVTGTLEGGEEIIWHDDLEVLPLSYDFPVRVPEGHGIRKIVILGDEDLQPENIKKGVTIFNVNGTHEGGSAIPEPYATYIAEAEEVYNGFALYNGVKLPKLPDASAYAYAYIIDLKGFVEGYSHTAYFTNTRLSVDASNNLGVVPTGDMATALITETGAWDSLGATTYDVYTNVAYTPVIWSNVDVLNPDNSVYLAASDPVPLDSYANVIYAEGYGKDTGATYRTVMFLLDNWQITDYDAATTEYIHSGCYIVQKEDNGAWVLTDYSTTTADKHYAKNIKAASLYIEYEGLTLFPVGINNYPDTTAIDYSAWDSGSFSETIETGDTLEYGVEFDASKRPIEITLPTGETVAVKWEPS